jgi:dienelactone hydrolase
LELLFTHHVSRFTFYVLRFKGGAPVVREMQLGEEADWKRRARARRIHKSQVAGANPARGVVLSNWRTDAPQLYAWDVPTGELRQLTRQPTGLWENFIISPDGYYVYYLQDEQGNELGHLVRVPFEGGEAEDLTPDMPPYSTRGIEISLDTRLLAFTAVNKEGYQLYRVPLGPNSEVGPRTLIHHSAREFWQAILSHGGELVAVNSTERTSKRLYNLLVFRTDNGELAGELWDGPEQSVEAVAFSPLPGDMRLLGTATNSAGDKRPLVWNVRTGERTDIALEELTGEVKALCWMPDGRRIVLGHFSKAVQQLYTYDLGSDTLTRLAHPTGAFGDYNYDGIYAGPQGHIWAQWSDSVTPSQLIELDSDTGEKTHTVLAADEVPPGMRWSSITFTSSDNVEVQGWLAVPEGEGPFPTILETHGGPHIVITETFRWSQWSQVWLDHGFAYLMINQSGSTTFGKDFLTKVWGDVGHWDLEDMVAARAWLVEQGITRPDQVLLTGASFGGYLTLLGLGKRPDLWAGGMAVVAIADWIAAYEDASEALRGAFRIWHGGSPEEVPERYIASSPITYAKNVRVPVLIMQERNDTRCPARQVEMYEAKMKSLGKEIEVIWESAGHAGAGSEQNIRFHESMLRFAYRVLDLTPAMPGD